MKKDKLMFSTIEQKFMIYEGEKPYSYFFVAEEQSKYLFMFWEWVEEMYNGKIRYISCDRLRRLFKEFMEIEVPNKWIELLAASNYNLIAMKQMYHTARQDGIAKAIEYIERKANELNIDLS